MVKKLGILVIAIGMIFGVVSIGICESQNNAVNTADAVIENREVTGKNVGKYKLYCYEVFRSESEDYTSIIEHCELAERSNKSGKKFIILTEIQNGNINQTVTGIE